MKADERILDEAIRQYGMNAQVIMVFEEMSELQKELCKHLRGKDNLHEIAEEIADVEIMLAQMKMVFNCAEEVSKWRQKKIARLEERLNGGKSHE